MNTISHFVEFCTFGVYYTRIFSSCKEDIGKKQQKMKNPGIWSTLLRPVISLSFAGTAVVLIENQIIEVNIGVFYFIHMASSFLFHFHQYMLAL